jgi:2-hydroxycyclohexanecarboxyl-CoA dehydrogenase
MFLPPIEFRCSREFGTTMRGISDKTILVTGSGSGIGRAIARRFAEEGASVAVNDIDEAKAQETVDIITDDDGDVFPVVADVTATDELHEMAITIREKRGPVDVLVNNAGWDKVEWFTEIEQDVMDRIVDINLRSQLQCSQVFAQQMIEADVEGCIVNISSDAGRIGNIGEVVYSGSKAGVIGYSKALARELARYNITCNVVAPGPTDTKLANEIINETAIGKKVYGQMKEQIPLGRIGSPEDIAGAVAFMASDDASFVTGQVLSVSGGLTMTD